MKIAVYSDPSILTYTNMEIKKALSFTSIIVAIILGVTLFKQFDFGNLKFEKPALAVVYLIGFAISIYFLVKGSKKQTEK